MKNIIIYCKRLWKYNFVHTIVYSVLLNMIIECLNRRSLIGLVYIFTNPVIFLYNTLIILMTMSVGLLFKRRIFAYGMISFIWILAAVINFVVLSLRKTPFTAMDIYLISDAIKIIPVYLKRYQMVLIAIGLLAAVALLIWIFIKAPRYKEKINYISALIRIGVTAGLLYYLTIVFVSSGILSKNFGNLANAYKKYGFAYCFSCSIVGRGISKEDDYSTEYMSSLKEQLDDGEAVNSQQRPNIIFLQLESFFDPNLLKGITFSENPVPVFEELYNKYSSGFLSVPVFGAGTANTEFEIQTGMNMDDFGPGEYPYETVLQTRVCESTAYVLSELGYVSHALHNNYGTFYDRHRIFSHLGYDTFTSIEYMDDLSFTPTGWARDKVLTAQISNILDSTEGSDYIYTISVQGHGDYPSVMPDNYAPAISVEGFFDEDNTTAFEYYVNQLKEMDDFIKELTDYLTQRDEETVLVMYGDHLPGFEFEDDMLVNENIYQTQYIIWNNFNMNVNNKDMEAYQLSSYVLEQLGISNGYINRFHQQQQGSADYLKNLKILEYDILYGNCDIYDGQMPYLATNLKMGIQDIKINCEYNSMNNIYIEGEHFNNYSAILINDVECESELLSGNLIRVKDKELKKGDVVSVIQRGKDLVELSRVYMEYE